MVTRLGQMAVEEKLISGAQLAEALEAQVVHGGHLGTNLVELGFLQEPDLVRLLGKQFGIPSAGGEMTPDPKALEAIDANTCDQHDLVPMRIDATKIHLAVMNPSQIKVLDDLSFRLGKRVVPVVVPEFRINQLLRKYCDAFRPPRAIDVDGGLARQKQQTGPQEPAKVEDLINEEDFAQLYAQAMGHDEPELVLSDQVDDPAVSAPRIIEPIGVMPVGVAKAEPPLQPIAFAEAQQLLASSVGREDIARVLLRFAVGKFKRSLLLSVQKDLLLGWRGAGHGVREKAVRRIGISLREQNTFRLVAQTRSHFAGPLKRTPGTAVFFKLLGGGFPQTAVMMPMLVHERVVHLLYLDQGPDQLTPPDLGELMILSQSVGRSYDALIRQRQG